MLRLSWSVSDVRAVHARVSSLCVVPPGEMLRLVMLGAEFKTSTVELFAETGALFSSKASAVQKS